MNAIMTIDERAGIPIIAVRVGPGVRFSGLLLEGPN
jgi:hypothetical protein